MALNNVVNPYEYFNDPDKGRPIFRGDIYVGIPDTDPEIPANQKQVTARQEDGTELPLAQPIKTNSGGNPVDLNGNPVMLFVDGNYSIKVLDRIGSEEYYQANVRDGVPLTDATISEYTNIVYNNVSDAKSGLLPDGSTKELEIGETATTLGYYSPNDGGGGDYTVVAGGTGTDDGGSYHDMTNGNQLEYIVYGDIRCSQFGATTSNANSKQNIENMLVFANGRKTVIDQDITITEGISVTNVNVDLDINGTIDGSGLPVATSLDQQIILTVNGSEGSTSSLTADLPSYAGNIEFSEDTVIQVADGSLFQKDDLVLLQSDQLFDDAWTGSTSNKRGELLRVESVSGNNVTTTDKAYFSYSSAQNARLTKINPVRSNISGGKIIGGGVGKGHNGIKYQYCENSNIDNVISTDCEDIAFNISGSYKVLSNVVAENCTSSATIGNTGYGYAVLNGARHVTVQLEAYNCRHSISGGGTLPALSVFITGHAVDCGIETNAWDCHEPCFLWTFDVTATGGDGGIVCRGSDITISIESNDCEGTGIRVRTFGTVTEQKNIHIAKAIIKNHKGAAIILGNSDSPLRKVTADYYYSNNTRLDGFLIQNDVQDVSVSEIVIDKTFLNDGESGTSGVGFRILGTSKSVKNIDVSSLIIRNTLKECVNITEADSVSFGYVRAIENTDTNRIEITNTDNITFSGGVIDIGTNFAGFNTNTVNNMLVGGFNIKGDAGTAVQDGWSAIDSLDCTMINCKVLTGRYAGQWTGTSDHLILTNNNVREVVNADKFATGAIASIIEANNLS